MANTVFSLDIQDDVVTGVVVDTSQKVPLVVDCALSTVGSRSLSEAIGDVVQQLGCDQARCRVSLGADSFYYRVLRLPFAEKKKIGQVLPFELEENSPKPIQSLVVDAIITAREDGESDVLVAMLEKQFLAEQLAELQSMGLDPEYVTVSGLPTIGRLLAGRTATQDFVFLDIGLHRATLIVVVADRIALIRSFVFDGGGGAGFHLGAERSIVVPPRQQQIDACTAALGHGVRNSLLSLPHLELDTTAMPLYLGGPLGAELSFSTALQQELGMKSVVCDLSQMPLLKIGGRAHEKWVAPLMDRALGLALFAERSAVQLNFRRDEFAQKTNRDSHKRLLRRALIPVSLIFLVFVGYLWQDYSAKKARLQQLQAEIESVFRATLPEVTRMVDPVQQLRVKLREVQQSVPGHIGSGGTLTVLDLLAEISQRTPAALPVKVDRMVVAGDSVTLHGITDTFTSVDTLTQQLQQSPSFTSVTIGSATLARNKDEVRFEIKCVLGAC